MLEKVFDVPELFVQNICFEMQSGSDDSGFYFYFLLSFLNTSMNKVLI